MPSQDTQINYPSYTAQENAKNLDIATGVFGGLSGLSGVLGGYSQYVYRKEQYKIAVGDFDTLNTMELYRLREQMFAGVRMCTIFGGVGIVLSAAKDGVLVPTNASDRRKVQVAVGIIGKVLLAAGPNIITIGGYNESGVEKSLTATTTGIVLTIAGLALIGVSQDVGGVVDWGNDKK